MGSDVVVLGHGQLIGTLESCTPGVVRMHGTNRAPMSIKIYVDGPIIGLNWGCIMMGEPVTIEFLIISATKTDICTSVVTKVTQGIFPVKKPFRFKGVGWGTNDGPF